MSDEPEEISVSLTARDKAVLGEAFDVYQMILRKRYKWPQAVRREAIGNLMEVASKFNIDLGRNML